MQKLTQSEMTCLSIGYQLAYNDMLKILSQLNTDANRTLIIEILGRIEHDMEIRKQTGFLPNYELYQG
ncbi:MAG: hypothetical protein KatS3mg031_2962 [Chitinophagales bacterium]|nr:MAG: hypothetical protein KatS3mg031_2962 [Chitinophagales bacterium]